MDKKVLKEIWGTYAEAARQIGVGRSTISEWPDKLTPRMQARVVFAVLRSGKKLKDEWLNTEEETA